MSDYTPSLDEVREDYKLFAGDGEYRAKAHAEFDRMIEAVRAEEREKAAQIAENSSEFEVYMDEDGHRSIRIREQGS